MNSTKKQNQVHYSAVEECSDSPSVKVSVGAPVGQGVRGVVGFGVGKGVGFTVANGVGLTVAVLGTTGYP